MNEPFSFTVTDNYRVTPLPRWGYGRPSHSQIQSVLERGRSGYEKVLDELDAQRAILHQISHVPVPAYPLAPFWNNPWFSTLDAAALVGLLISRKPRRYLEIGSGNSTMFAAYAIQTAKLPTTIISIDPHPRESIDTLCARTIREPLENCALDLFDELEAGDILFFDGSHRIFQNSDVTAFFLDVMPRLKPGILVHLHDIFLPIDYPPAWNTALYSEQYLLAAMLLCGQPPFRVVLPNQFVSLDPSLGGRVREIFSAPDVTKAPDIPFSYVNQGDTLGCSFWLEMTQESFT
jgi:hypothetical protein